MVPDKLYDSPNQTLIGYRHAHVIKKVDFKLMVKLVDFPIDVLLAFKLDSVYGMQLSDYGRFVILGYDLVHDCYILVGPAGLEPATLRL